MKHYLDFSQAPGQTIESHALPYVNSINPQKWSDLLFTTPSCTVDVAADVRQAMGTCIRISWQKITL